MSGPTPPTLTDLEWLVQTIRLGSFTVPVARLRFRVYFLTSSPSVPAMAEWCWFDSAAPLSVVPYCVHSQGLAWKPVAGVQTTWASQTCDVGRINIWLPTSNPASVRGPFSLLAKFPQKDPPGPPAPILLGLEFLLSYQASCAIRPLPRPSALEIP